MDARDEMGEMDEMDRAARRARLKADNRRTGLWLALLALLFFVLLFVKRLWLR